jgi:hypothetical protein
MSHIQLGALIVEHDHGIPLAVRQIGGRDAHPAVVEALLASVSVLELCEQDADENPEELCFD